MEWINFKVRNGERGAIRRDAHRHEMNVSQYLRWLIARERERQSDERNG